LLRHGYLAAVLPATLSMLGMIGLALVMQYERETVLVITLLALAVPPYALTMITESVIKGRNRMHLITIGNVPGNVFLVTCSFVFLAAGYGVLTVAAIIVASRIITLLTMHALYRLSAADCRPARLRPRFSWLLLKKSLVFLGTDGIQAIKASLFGLLLSIFATEREIGLLGAAFQLMQPIQLFYRSVGHSCFPPLVSAARVNGAAVANLSRSVLGLIIRLAFPATLAVFCLSGDLLVTVYGNSDFREGAVVLQILAFTLLLDPSNHILGHGLWAMNRDGTVFRIVVVNLIANAVVGLILVSQFGLVGAAWSALLASVLNTSQHYWYFVRNVDRLHLTRELVKIAPAAIAAIACVALLPINRFASLSAALLIYACLAFFPLDQFSLQGQVSPKSVD